MSSELREWFFALLGLLFVFIAFFFLLAAGMVAEGRPFPLSIYVFLLVFLAIAAGCFWLATPEAWSPGRVYSVLRAIILATVALCFGDFGFRMVTLTRTDIAEGRTSTLGGLAILLTFALPIFAVAGACLWAAVPPAWKRTMTIRNKLLDQP